MRRKCPEGFPVVRTQNIVNKLRKLTGRSIFKAAAKAKTAAEANAKTEAAGKAASEKAAAEKAAADAKVVILANIRLRLGAGSKCRIIAFIHNVWAFHRRLPKQKWPTRVQKRQPL
jgi:hypothetical protein